MAAAAAGVVDAAAVVAEAEGYEEGIAWAACASASAAAAVALRDEQEAEGVAEAATGPSLKGGEESVAALSAAVEGRAASGWCSEAGCGEVWEAPHPPGGPGEAEAKVAGESWAVGLWLLMPLEGVKA